MGYQVGDKISNVKISLGRLPIMIRSNICNLHRHVMIRPRKSEEKRKGAAEITTPRERCELLAGAGEEPFEQGGFYIVNGIEKLNRMINLARRNYPHAYIREAYEQSGTNTIDILLPSLTNEKWKEYDETLFYASSASELYDAYHTYHLISLSLRKSFFFFFLKPSCWLFLCIHNNISSFLSIGSAFTSYVVQMRSARKDHTGNTINLHYLRTGDITIRFVINGVSFFIPAAMLLKAWKSSTDLEIYHAIVQSNDDDTWLTDRVECLLRAVPVPRPEDGPPHHNASILRQIGRAFKDHLPHPDHYTLADLGQHVLDRNLLIHLDNSEDKFNTLVYV